MGTATQDLDAGRGPHLLPFDAYRLVCGPANVPSEVDEGGLVPLGRRPASVFPLCCPLYNHLEMVPVSPPQSSPPPKPYSRRQKRSPHRFDSVAEQDLR
jgi:hypothetical protein